MNTYKLYIGANNSTGKVDNGIIERILNKFYDGYTIEHATGYWKGTREPSVLVTISSENDIVPVIYKLKKDLKQDAIAYQVVEELRFI